MYADVEKPLKGSTLDASYFKGLEKTTFVAKTLLDKLRNKKSFPSHPFFFYIKTIFYSQSSHVPLKFT